MDEKEEYPETNYRKSALAFGSTLLAGSIVTGPVAPVVAAVGSAIIVGVGIRRLLNRKAEDRYQEENAKRKGKEYSKNRGRKVEKTDNSFYPESSETAIARRNEFIASDLLKEYTKAKIYDSALSAASNITHSYLSNLPRERLEKSRGVSISFERKSRGLVGLVTGKDNGFKLDIDLK